MLRNFFGPLAKDLIAEMARAATTMDSLFNGMLTWRTGPGRRTAHTHHRAAWKSWQGMRRWRDRPWRQAQREHNARATEAWRAAVLAPDAPAYLARWRPAVMRGDL